MKRKLLQLSLLLITLGVAGFVVLSGFAGSPLHERNETENRVVAEAAKYLQEANYDLRTNLLLSGLASDDVQSNNGNTKSGKSLELNWVEMGPDNYPGKVNAMVFDKNDETGKTIIAGSNAGGLWITKNLGATWLKINKSNQNLFVSTLAQAPNGDFYAGTGEAYYCTATSDASHVLMGQGLFRSTNGDDFVHVNAPELGDFINNIAVDKTSGRIYVASNTGLWYSDDDSQTWNRANRYYHDTMTYNVTIAIDSTVFCDSVYKENGDVVMINPQYNTAIVDTTEYIRVALEKNRTVMEFADDLFCTDVEVAYDGTVAANFYNLIWIAPGGNSMVFTNKSGTSVNPYLITSDNISYTTTLIAIDTNNVTESRTVNFNGLRDFAPDPAFGRPSPLHYDNKIFVARGRAQIVFAPSDETGNIIYVANARENGQLYNVYLSEDKGETWQIIFPGGSSTLEPYYGLACDYNLLEVFPNNPYQILLGGAQMWMGQRIEGFTGYFDWGLGPITFELPFGHTAYVFQPGTSNKLAVGSNYGVSYGTVGSGTPSFTGINKLLSNTRSLYVGIGGLRDRILTGTVYTGTLFVSGTGNTPNAAEFIDSFFTPDFCDISIINPDALYMYSEERGTMGRTEDYGLSVSANFNVPPTNLTSRPFVLWEDFIGENSRDSVTFINNDTINKTQGETLICRSANNLYPFEYILDQEFLEPEDSIRVKDIIQSKLFFASHDGIHMTKDAAKFATEVEWWKLSAVSATNHGNITCMANSSDADYLFAGTSTGKVFRVSNIALAYDFLRADLSSPYQIVATDIIQGTDFEGRRITSVSVDQNDPNNILITLSDYRKDDYVYRSTNALASPATNVTFTNITGSLPKKPVFSSLIEMNDPNTALVGTEEGIYYTTNFLDTPVEWIKDINIIGRVPVMQIKQQTVFKDEFVIPDPDPTAPPIVFPRVNNYGDIYIATYGRGVFRSERFFVNVNEIAPQQELAKNEVFIYPNPVTSIANISFQMKSPGEVSINIYNINGMLIKEHRAGTLQTGSQTLSLDLSDLISGAYVVMVSTGNEAFSNKFIVR
jgi:hypothetical protein